MSGLDAAVGEYLDNQSEVTALCGDIRDFLAAWIPRFAAGRRRYLSIAIGCTGGRHRSVYMAERLAAYFRDHSAKVLLRHRDLPIPACGEATGTIQGEASP